MANLGTYERKQKGYERFLDYKLQVSRPYTSSEKPELKTLGIKRLFEYPDIKTMEGSPFRCGTGYLAKVERVTSRKNLLVNIRVRCGMYLWSLRGLIPRDKVLSKEVYENCMSEADGGWIKGDFFINAEITGSSIYIYFLREVERLDTPLSPCVCSKDNWDSLEFPVVEKIYRPDIERLKVDTFYGRDADKDCVGITR